MEAPPGFAVPYLLHDVNPSFKAVLKRLELSRLLPVLPDRTAYATKTSLLPLDFLELVL